MFSRATIFLLFLFLLGACAESQSIEATPEEIEAWRVEITGERAKPTPFPTRNPAQGTVSGDDLIPVSLSMTDLLTNMCLSPGPVDGASPYELKPGVHPIWIVDLFSTSGGNGTSPRWLQSQWSASDASTVELIGCMSLVPVGNPINCETTTVVGSFIAMDVYVASSGILLGRFSNATEAVCADFDTTAYVSTNSVGDQIVADIEVINTWLEPIVVR